MQTDNQLIRKIKRQQNRAAADELITRYYREIYAFVYKQTGEKELAMDLTQEIFIRVLQGIYSFDEKKAQFRTWLYRIASNRITDYYRSNAHRIELLEQSELEEISQGQAADMMHDLSDMIVKREWIGRIMEVMVTYGQDWVAIFQKKCFLQMTFEEIAEEMDLSVNTVKTRFYSMIRRIRQEVDFDE
jgi:RNA polymerase sigma-70 factor (ECF subfamily)